MDNKILQLSLAYSGLWYRSISLQKFFNWLNTPIVQFDNQPFMTLSSAEGYEIVLKLINKFGDNISESALMCACRTNNDVLFELINKYGDDPTNE